MWFVTTEAAEAVAVIGFFTIEGDVLGMTWMPEAKSPLLLLSLASGMLQGLTPDLSQPSTGMSAPQSTHWLFRTTHVKL